MNYNNDYSRTDNRGGGRSEWRCPVSVLLIIICVTIVGTMLLTFSLASNWVKQQDFVTIQKQQQTIDNQKQTIDNLGNDILVYHQPLTIGSPIVENVVYTQK